jgi:hypothetical protein
VFPVPFPGYLFYTIIFKGTVARDFPPPFYFHQKHLPTLYPEHILCFFEFGFKFVELLGLKFDSPLHHAAVTQILPLHNASGSRILLPNDAAGISSAVGSQE